MNALTLGTIGGEHGIVRLGDATFDVSTAIAIREQLDAAIRAASGDTAADRALDDWLDAHFRGARPVAWWPVGDHRRRERGVAVTYGRRTFLRTGARTVATLLPHGDGRRLVGFVAIYRPGRFSVADQLATPVRVAVRVQGRMM